MNNFKSSKKSFGFLSAVIMAVAAVGCSNNIAAPESSTSSEISAAETSAAETAAEIPQDEIINADPLESPPKNITYEYADVFSDRDLNPAFDDITAEIKLNGSSAECSSSKISVDGSNITITEKGIYRFSGTLDDGQIIVNAPDAKVQIILDNADITCSTSSAIYGADSKKIFISLAENSVNNLTDGRNYADETSPDACIFSKDSLTINGKGTLNINSAFSGIHSKDDVVITGGNINITSGGDGIKGKDYVAVADGNISINSGEDGIKSTNDTSLGYVYIQNGGFVINSAQDGIQAETDLIILNGNFDITSGGGSENSTKTHSDGFGGMGGDFRGGKGFMREDMTPPDGFNPQDFENVTPPDGFGRHFENMTPETQENQKTTSTKGLKGGSSVNIIGGEFTINSADDAVHSENVVISGDSLTLATGNKGIHADGSIYINGGDVNITNSYEGIEGAVINVSDGNINVYASDDGFNASGSVINQDGIALNISGGSVYVNADGDGLDSNGDMTISDGTVIIDGPTSGGDGALDSENGIIVTGGTVIAAGSSQMAECPGSSSTQYMVSATFDSTQQAGTSVKLLDENGCEIINFTSAKTFDNIIISSPDILKDKTYTFYLNGTENESFTASEIISTIGRQSMMGGGMHGGRGDFQPPDNEMPDRDFGRMRRNSDINL